MLIEILKHLNWVDIFLVFLTLRILIIAAKNGFVIEFFKLLGIIATIYVSFHYYTPVADAVKAKFNTEKLTLDFLDFLIFTFLVFLTYLLFAFLRMTICHFIKMEAVPALSRWGGFMLGIGRSVLCASLIIYMFFISTIPYVADSAKKSYFGPKLFAVSTGFYRKIWHGIAANVMKQEKINSTVDEVEEGYHTP